MAPSDASFNDSNPDPDPDPDPATARDKKADLPKPRSMSEPGPEPAQNQDQDGPSETLSSKEVLEKLDRGDEEYLEQVKKMRSAWKDRRHFSTLPHWASEQTRGIDLSKMNLPDVDDETKEWIVRELLITLRCHYCERRRSKECNFAVCVRGLTSGFEPFGKEEHKTDEG